MTRVCLISPYPPQQGGISEYSRSLSEELSTCVEVTVLAQAERGEIGKSEHDNSVLVRWIWEKNSLLTPFRLFKDVLRIKPAIVHIQYESYGLYGLFDFITTPLMLFLLRTGRFPTFLTLHSFIESPRQRARDMDYATAGVSGKAFKYLYQVLRTTVRLAIRSLQVKVIVHSNVLADKLKILGFKPQNIAVIPIGSPKTVRRTQKLEAKRKLGLDGEKVVLFFGFISAAKKISDLILAFREVLRNLPRCVAIISGVPSAFDPKAKEYHDELKEQARWTERIIFMDRFIPDEEVDVLFSAADIFVLTYSINQGSSAALPLALAYGLPVVVPKGGTSGNDVEMNQFGLVYMRDNPNSLAQQIISILSDENLLKNLSERGSKISTLRGWDVVAKKTLDFYGI